MDKKRLEETAKRLVEKGILAADESHGTPEHPGTMRKRLRAVGLDPSDETIQAYRAMLFSTQGLENYISGVIVTPQTLVQEIDGKSAASYLDSRGMVPVVKVDTGSHKRFGEFKENNTTGTDDLHSRLDQYVRQGAKATKWRAVFEISEQTPTTAAIAANGDGLALYARLVQDAGLVPIVEPEVLHEGSHSISACYNVTSHVLRTVFERLKDYGVHLEGIVLKPSMVLTGKGHPDPSDVSQVAEMTYRCLDASISHIPGVAFLSGGQSDEQAVSHLNAINSQFRAHASCKMTFSYGRGLVAEPLKIWAQENLDRTKAQLALLERAEACWLASTGALCKDFSYRQHAER